MDPVVRNQLTGAGGSIVELEGSEAAKTLAECEKILVAMKRAGVTRGDTLAAVGGGVIQDVATLTASLYMRGIDWTYVPTTLMAMADSCIGGKSSINAGGIKNLVGNFHPPKQILVDPKFIGSLPQRAIVSGLSEAVKICFARGHDSFLEFMESRAATHPASDQQTVALLTHVLQSKKWFVEVDELDRAERQLLNFGHSFGHAWEAGCGFTVQHGIGVAVGMLAAIRHPVAAHTDLTQRLEDYTTMLLETVKGDIQAAKDATDWETFRSALSGDKKNTRESLRLILPAERDSVRLVELPLNDEELEIAQDAICTVLEDIAA